MKELRKQKRKRSKEEKKFENGPWEAFRPNSRSQPRPNIKPETAPPVLPLPR
jgi:hypothetical protein